MITFGSGAQTAHSILEIVRKRRAELADAVCVGRPKTIEVYREYVGRITELDEIESEIVKALNDHQR